MMVPTDDVPPLDPHTIEMLSADLGRDTLVHIIGLWRQTAHMARDRIATAVTERQGEQLRTAAHQLKGSSANLGATRLAALCSQLERHGAASDFTTAPTVVAALFAEYTRVDEAMSEYR